MTKIRSAPGRAWRWVRSRDGWKLWAAVALAFLSANMLIVNGAFVWERQGQVETNAELRDQLSRATGELECRADLNNTVSDADAEASIAILEGLISVAQREEIDPELVAHAQEVIDRYREAIADRGNSVEKCKIPEEDPPP